MKKALNIIKNILVWAILLAAVGMMIFTIFSVNTFDQSHRSVFGYKFFIVRSDSMSATDFSAGDIIFVKAVDPASLREGDIIAYTSQNTSNFGETVTHKIRSLVTTKDGEPGFVTYGTTNNTDDETVVTYPYVLGKYTGRLPNTAVTEPLVIADDTDYVLYTVAEGATLEMLAEHYGVPAEEILSFNNITELTVGETIKIPHPKVTEPFVLPEEKPSDEPGGDETPTPSESPAPTETPTPTETPAPSETPAAAESPEPTETPAPSETPQEPEAPSEAEPESTSEESPEEGSE